ncbi:twin-arginine translocation signal domain-containing protein [Streptomyces malaysiensis]|uniref:twin-arginine translocation signal domain-containing protein n=1 Tax=Streptomyces malaysiensis TaxID=92644 RepID=UPI002B2EE1F7|nr:twin-arginine translocation signal domain-containing protein [Streptomyces malaysiensis]
MTPLPRRHFLAGTAVAGGLLAVGAPGGASASGGVVDSGERYSWMGGELTPAGRRVLITGRSPLRYRLTLR